MAGDWTTGVPALARLDEATRTRLRGLTRPLAVRAGTRLFGEGSACQAYLFLLAGSVRVQKIGENGREIMLYRLTPGETCILTTVCLMSGEVYDAEAVAETDISAQCLSITDFHALLGQSAAFRELVFQSFGARIADLLMVIEEVSFGRIDQRLAACLMAHAADSRDLTLTHRDLAAELGTAREVVSRHLKDFERRGWISLSRGKIRLSEPNALRVMAEK